MSKGIGPGTTGTSLRLRSGEWQLVDGAGNFIASFIPTAIIFGNTNTNPTYTFNGSGDMTVAGRAIFNGPALVVNGLLSIVSMASIGTITATNLTVSGAVTLTSALPVAQGGTGAANAATARSNLGVTATGADTTYAFRANNLSDLANAATSRSNLGLGTLATLNTAAASNVSGGVLRQASLGSGVVTVSAGGTPSGGADGDIWLVY